MSVLRSRHKVPSRGAVRIRHAIPAVAVVAALGLPAAATAGPPVIDGESTVSVRLSAEVRADLGPIRRSGDGARRVALARIDRAVRRLELAQKAAAEATAAADVEARMAARRVAAGLSAASVGLAKLVASSDRAVATRARTALRRLAALHAQASATTGAQVQAGTTAQVEAGAEVLADLSASLRVVLSAVTEGGKAAHAARRGVVTEVLEARAALAAAAQTTRERAAATGASVGDALRRVVAHAVSDAARLERSSLGTVRVRVSADGRLSLAELALRVVAASQTGPETR